MRRHISFVLAALLVSLTAAGPPAHLEGRGVADLPARLTDAEFWALSTGLSEPNGAFQSDNLLSNEIVFARIVPELIEKTRPEGVYLGVGPEQNFTYMAAMRPRMAFITDIRRGNLHMQLMYKGLFELSGDRAEFVSRLFSKKRPDGLTKTSTAKEIFDAYWNVPTVPEAEHLAYLQELQRHLTKTHSIPLSQDDLDGIANVYRTFYWYGPVMTYSASTRLQPVSPQGTNYATLMTQSDANGRELSYLASDDKFQFLKDLERRNLVVPVVGNFSGPKALRAIGSYLKDHGAVVSAFYLSNVEMYLRREGTWPAFCANVATMPLDESSVFIRPSAGGGIRMQFVQSPAGSGRSMTVFMPPPTVSAVEMRGSGLVPMREEVKSCGAALN